MVETINLDQIPNRIAQFISKTPVEILIENGHFIYNNTINKISTGTIHAYDGGSENTVYLDNDVLLFANTYENVNIYSNLASYELGALLNSLSKKISQFKFEEDLTLFHLDKVIVSKPNLLKVTEQNSFNVDYIISSTLPVIFSYSKGKIRVTGPDLSVKQVNEPYVRSLIYSEISNSLTMIKIAENSNIDIADIMKKLAKYSTLVDYNKSLRTITIKLNVVVDLKYELMKSYLNPRMRDLITIDRTKWLSN